MRADATLNKQTAQSTSSAPAAKQVSQRPAKAQAVAVPPPDEMWSRRSYAILIVVIAVLELIVTTIQWAMAPPPRDALWVDLLGLNPISLLVAAIIAPFIARPLTGERRPLRPVESLMVGVIAYFIAVFVYTGIGFLLLQTGSGATGSVGPTPCPVTATCTTTATPSPAATPTPAATAKPSATATASEFSAAPSPSASSSSSSTTSVQLTAGIVGGYVVGDLIIYAATLFVYPPLYKRLRLRRPPPPAQRQRPTKGAGASTSADAKKQSRQEATEEQHSPTAPKPPRRLWPF